MRSINKVILMSVAIAAFAMGENAKSCGGPKPKTLSTSNPNVQPSGCGNRCLAVQPVLLKMVETNQQKLGGLIRVTSGWRNCAINSKSRGVRNSDHLYGRAIDSNWGQGNGRCREYRTKAMQIHGKRFPDCFHVPSAPHLHMSTGGAPCKNCGKPTNYKRTTPSLERKKTRGPRKPKSAPRYKRAGANWVDGFYRLMAPGAGF